MKTKQSPVNSLLFALLFSVSTSMSLSNSAFAESFPFSAAPSTVKAARDASQNDVSMANVEIDASNFQFLNGVDLTVEQRGMFVQVFQKQMPAINSNIAKLENARAMLREMAIAKFYDATLADIAADRIANSTAALAVLQAEREYQVLAVLTSEQASIFRK
jgi:Spy/CpxP family protein refolding chaperone